jgi:hypothetical protein
VLAGTATLQVMPTTGLVGTGDFIACAHLIIASGDSTGGILTVIRNIDGNRQITMFYGTSFKNVPHMKLAGNAVVPHPITMNYSGWVQALTAPENAAKVIWAVGNELGVRGHYRPYGLQEGHKADETPAPISSDIEGVEDKRGDTYSPITNVIEDNISSTNTPWVGGVEKYEGASAPSGD